MTTIDVLHALPLFEKVAPRDLEWLVGKAHEITVPEGGILMHEGDPGGAMYIVLDGEFEFTKRSGNQEVTLAVRGAGELIGEVSFLDAAPRSATARALRDSRLLMIRADAFDQLITNNPSATRAILATAVSRLRNTESMLRQSEKMAALGTMSAGLAHELNNPAAAARRSAAHLKTALLAWQRLTEQLYHADLSAAQTERIGALREEMLTRTAAPPSLDPLARSDRESELQEWFEQRHVDNAWELTPALVSFGWDVASFAALERALDCGSTFALVVQWLGAGYSAFALADEVGKSTERISDIVGAVKSYAYLDQAPIQEVDVHKGLEDTLTMLRFKLKQGIHVTRDYAPDLPRIQAYGSELNQVWTNLIDNAVDAMHGQGELVIRTRQRGGDIVVELEDNGPGIPPAIQPRIFEPFFTTKPVGVGTGMGLNITYNIIQKHRGKISVDSHPGRTVFTICLPVQSAPGR